ncbi:MAG: AIR synthase related protein [archaeon]
MIHDLRNFYQNIKKQKAGSYGTQIRDLTKIDIGSGISLIVAVDSDGGIGPLEGDVVKCSAYQAGRFAMRVPLLEILASGAIPVAAFDMLMVPMQPNGAEIVRGIRDELTEAGFGEGFPLSGSTEDNVPTNMTGIGTTIIGFVHETEMRPGTSHPDDVVLCVGTPKTGPEDKITLDDPDIISQQDFLCLRQIPTIHDILPVGSHGIFYEAGEMARLAGLKIEIALNPSVNLKKSAGPATCVLVSGTDDSIDIIKKSIKAPIFFIGRFNKKG